MLYQVIASCLLSTAQLLHNTADSNLSCITVQGEGNILLVWCGLYVYRHRPQYNMTLQGYCIGAVQSNDNTISINAHQPMQDRARALPDHVQ